MAGPVLMSSDNPEGWKLEELLVQLIVELHGKCMKISDDRRWQANSVHGNNMRIIEMLREARLLQINSMDILEQMGPNQGPLGAPRIGVNPTPTGLGGMPKF